MELGLLIPGRLSTINDYTAKCRSNPYAGAKLKRDEQSRVEACVITQLHTQVTAPAVIHYTYYEANKRRDHDNVAGWAHKVIQDALVQCGVLIDDGWGYVTGFTDVFRCDPKNPRIEVIIEYGTKTNV